MLFARYIQAEVASGPSFVQNCQWDIATLKRVAGLQWIYILSPTLLTQPNMQVVQTYPIQDQTEQSRLQCIQIAGSLAARATTAPALQAIRATAREAGLPLREIEVDPTSGVGVMGMLDRTWYVLGDISSMQGEAIELGLASVALVNQLEASGQSPLFLALQGPKRLLAIFGCARQLRPDCLITLQELAAANLETSVIVEGLDQSSRSFYQSLPHLVMAESIAPDEGAATVEQGRRADEVRVTIGSTVYLLSDLNQIVELVQFARQLLLQARRRFFWCRI